MKHRNLNKKFFYKIQAVNFRRKLSVIGGVIGVMAIGSILIFSSAAGPALSTEPELFTSSGNGSVGTDTQASGGKFITLNGSSGSALNTGCNGSPLIITTGGTYSGCYVSTSANTPAITVSTTQPVTITSSVIKHAGSGITNGVNGTQITVTNSHFLGLDPGTPSSQRAVGLYRPSSLVVENNELTDGHGIYINGDRVPISQIRIRYNNATNIGRYIPPGCCIQFTQFDKVISGNAEIAWNRTNNTYGQSQVEDNINMFESGGLSDSQIINIHHNMIDGAWPRSGNGDGYAGGGILIGDNYTPTNSPGYIHSHHNRVINTANYGVSMTGGHDNHMYNNRVVSDGRNQSGALVSASYGTGVTLWDHQSFGNMVRVSAHDNAAGHIRTDGRSDFWLPACNPANACINNSSLATPTNALEQAERDAWVAEVAANGLNIGVPQVQTSPGTAQGTVSVATAANYRVWARMMAPDASANSFSLQVDSGSVAVMGDSVLTPNSWVWVDFANGNSTSKVNVNLAAGQHSLKLTGRENGVKIDRIILSGDTSCVPTGTGDNCAITTTPPPLPPVPTIVPEDINQDGKVNILDFSLLSAKFGSTTNLGRADINQDGLVNIIDFSLLAAKFGYEAPVQQASCSATPGAGSGAIVKGPTTYNSGGTTTVSNVVFEGSHSDDLVRVYTGKVIFENVTFRGTGTGSTGHSLEIKQGGSAEVRNSVFEGDPTEDSIQTENNGATLIECNRFGGSPGENHVDTKPGASVTVRNNTIFAHSVEQTLINHNTTNPVHFINNTGVKNVLFEDNTRGSSLVGNSISDYVWLYDAADTLVEKNTVGLMKHGESGTSRVPTATYFKDNTITTFQFNGGSCYKSGTNGASLSQCTTGSPPWL